MRRSVSLLRFWPILPATLIGYALFGDLGFIAGVVIACIVIALRQADTVKLRNLKRREIDGEQAAIFEPPSPAMLAALYIVLIGSVVLVVYAFFLEFNPVGIARKMEAIEPIGAVMAQAIPAIDNLPMRLTQIGQSQRAVGARYLLILGWIYLAVTLACGIAMMIGRSGSTTTVYALGDSPKRSVIFAVGGLIALLASSWLILFGAVTSSGLRGGRGPDGLPMIAIFFVVAAFGILFVLWACGDLLQRRRLRHEATESHREA